MAKMYRGEGWDGKKGLGRGCCPQSLSTLMMLVFWNGLNVSISKSFIVDWLFDKFRQIVKCDVVKLASQNSALLSLFMHNV